MRVIFIVGDHITLNGRGKAEAEQFAGAACTVLSRLEGADHEIHLFYYCYEQGNGGCRGVRGAFNYTFKALNQHGLECASLTEAKLRQGEGEIQVRMNWPAQDLIRETQRLLAVDHVALFLFAHGGGGGIELGRVADGPPKELLHADRLFQGAPSWQQLFTLHMHCHAGKFFKDQVYTNAKTEKRMGLGISNQEPTQGHVMMVAAESLAEGLVNILAMMDAGLEHSEVYEQLQWLQGLLANSSNGLLAGQEGILYGKTQKVTFDMGTKAQQQ